MSNRIKYLAVLLAPFFLFYSCTKEIIEQQGQDEQGWTSIHYRATAVGGDATKATLTENPYSYRFERTDRLYIEDNSGNLYGFLHLVSGEGDKIAVFEGDLMYFDDNNEPSEPASSLPISATLVSANDRLHTVENGRIVKPLAPTPYPDYPDDEYATSFIDAVQKYSHFIGNKDEDGNASTYGNPSFVLEQQTAFLICSITFDEATNSSTYAPEGRSLGIQIKDNAEVLWNASVTTILNGPSVQANFVAAFPGGTVLSSSSMLTINNLGPSSGASTTEGITGATLAANNYYNVKRTLLDLTHFSIIAKEDATQLSFNTSSGVQYKDGTGNWIDASTSPITLNGSEKVILRAKGTAFSGSGSLFTSTKPCYIFGDIMSLFCTAYDGDSETRAPSLGANALKETFSGMPVDIPSGRALYLSATSLGDNAYQGMFSNCTSLSIAPEFASGLSSIPASGCAQMFSGCSSLVVAPELPASDVGVSGYEEMFFGCTSLAMAPTQVAGGTLGTSACQRMFYGCTSLATVPTLPTTTVPDHGYAEMFSGCTTLVTGLSSLPATSVGASGYEGMFSGCEKMKTAPGALPATDLSSGANYKDMFSGCKALYFSSAPSISATVAGVECFSGMFRNCIMLSTGPSALSITSIPESACYQMFMGCTTLVTAPTMNDVLTASTVRSAGCQEMFFNCSSLTTPPPSLKAQTVEENGYYKMFRNCDKIETAPTIEATTVSNHSCEEMFYDCDRLTAPPALPAISLGESCYKCMFESCNLLNISSELAATLLPATNLATSCYQSMFQGCTTLTTVPALPATVLSASCYEEMFRECKALLELPNTFLPATTLALACYRQMFWQCEKLNTVPSGLLPATDLAKGCYANMFNGCKALTLAPDLPATVPQPGCYFSMFRNCPKLTYVKCALEKANFTSMSDVQGNCATISDQDKTTPCASSMDNWTESTLWSVINKWLNGSGTGSDNNYYGESALNDALKEGDNAVGAVPTSRWTKHPLQ